MLGLAAEEVPFGRCRLGVAPTSSNLRQERACSAFVIVCIHFLSGMLYDKFAVSTQLASGRVATQQDHPQTHNESTANAPGFLLCVFIVAKVRV